MEYLYDNTLFSSKRNVVQYVEDRCNVKLRRAMSEGNLLPVDEDVCLLYHVSKYKEYLIRPLGILSDSILDDLCVLPESGKKGYITVYGGLNTDRDMYLKNRETIRKCIELFFKRECNFYYRSNRQTNGIFKILNNAVSVKIINWEQPDDDSCGVSLSFKCLYVKDGELKIVVIKFTINFNDFSWFCRDGYLCTDKYGYDTIDSDYDCPELRFEYRGDLSEKDVYDWVEYINSNYDFGSVVEIKDFYQCNKSFCGDVLMECKDYYGYLCKEAEKKIQPVTRDMIGKTVDCFESMDLSVYSYNGKKSKYADIHMKKGERFEVNKYYVYKDKMGFVLVTKSSKIYLGNIVPITNIQGEIVLYGLKIDSSSQVDSGMQFNKYYLCLTESLSVLQNTIFELNGKIHGKHNYIRDLITNSKYYRYAGLVGIRDCKFSTLFKFDNAIYAFIRYNGTIKLLTSKAKTSEEKKQLLQNIKKVISISSFRKLCVKRVYVFNIYQAESKIAASLNLSKKYIGNYTDFDKILEISKLESNVVFSVSCINKETNEIESKLILEGGSVVSIDGVSIEC